MRFVWWGLIGLIVGLAIGKTIKRPGYGAFGDLVFGVAGAIGGGCFISFVLRPFNSFYVAGGAMEVIADAGFVPSILFAGLGALGLTWLSHRWKKS